jgi:hypothetical protein
MQVRVSVPRRLPSHQQHAWTHLLLQCGVALPQSVAAHKALPLLSMRRNAFSRRPDLALHPEAWIVTMQPAVPTITGQAYLALRNAK